ncbi:MAG: hypothetical protein SW833_27700 [Cyanobacteriota bacterium]|nr:hypothetical protein [Cyanobacteriota bacterium]
MSPSWLNLNNRTCKRQIFDFSSRSRLPLATNLIVPVHQMGLDSLYQEKAQIRP